MCIRDSTYLENLVGNVKSVTNLFGNTDAKTVAQGLQILVNTKLSKTDKYDGVDSTSTELWATANAVRKVNEKTDNNSTSIRELNSNLMKSYDLLISSTSTTGINQVVDVDNYREILLCATHSSNGTIYNAAMIPIGLFKSTSAGSMFRCSGGSFFAQCYTANGSITASVSVDGYCAKIYGIK